MIYVVRYLAFLLYTGFWGLVMIVLALVDRSGDTAFWAARRWGSWIAGTCGIRVEAEGLEHVAPGRPCVLMTNHQSSADVLALVQTLPGEDWRFVAKRQLTWIPVFGQALRVHGHVIVDRHSNRRAVASLRAAAERIRGGLRVVIFPEGTRSPTGELLPFKSGGFHLALQAGVPIVPATISGSQRVNPFRSLRIESGAMKVVYGEPIPLSARIVA